MVHLILIRFAGSRGLFVYTTLNTLIALVVFFSNNRIEPREYDLKEYWTWRGSGRAPWFVRAMRRNRDRHHHRHESRSSDEDRNRDDMVMNERNENIAATNTSSSERYEEESQRAFSLRQGCETPRRKDGEEREHEREREREHARVHFVGDEYDYEGGSPLRGIAR